MANIWQRYDRSVVDKYRPMAGQNARPGAGGTMYGQLTGRDINTAKGATAEADQQRIFGARERKVQRFEEEGQGALNRSATAAFEAAMPQFQQQLQGLRESHIRRGVNLGDIGTRDEGSLTSAFVRNLQNAIAQGAQDQYGTSLDRLYGDLDRRTAEKNASKAARSNIWGAVGGLAGTALGRI